MAYCIDKAIEEQREKALKEIFFASRRLRGVTDITRTPSCANRFLKISSRAD